MTEESDILARIDELLALQVSDNSHYHAGEIYIAAISIATQLYGGSSQQVQAIKRLKSSVEGSKYTARSKADVLVQEIQGSLHAIASDVRGGRLGSLRLEFQGEVFAEFVNAAKAAASDGAKDVAAVLACASLEDVLKRFADSNGIDIEGKNLSTVVNALKAGGLVSAQQGALLKGMVPLRNKVLHADWGDVDEESVRSVIAFVEQLLITKFV